MQLVPLRVADADWEEFRAVLGRGGPEAIRGFIAWQLRRPGAAEPSRPAVPAEPRHLVPDAVLDRLIAWYLRQPGAELPRRPGGGTEAKMVRLRRADWEEFRDLHGGKASEAVKMFIAWFLRRPGAELPLRPPARDGQEEAGPA
jgi:hypothetical protein